MEWNALCGASGYIETAGSMIGTYLLSPEEVVLIDSGTKPDDALTELLDARGLRVRAILCTHLHLDHIGNNDALVERYGAEVYGHPAEIEVLNARTDVPYRHDYPIREIDPTQPIVIDGAVFPVLDTVGHSEGHVAIATPDGVCCVGDALLSSSKLEQSKLPYMEDVDRSIVAMEAIRATSYAYYVIAHRGVVTGAEMPALVEANIEKELLLYDQLRRCLTHPMSMEEAVDRYLREIGVYSQKMMEMDYVRWTAKMRIRALANAGEFCVEGERVVPRCGAAPGKISDSVWKKMHWFFKK